MSEGLSSARAAAVTAKGKPSREVEVEPGAGPPSVTAVSWGWPRWVDPPPGNPPVTAHMT